MPNFQLRFPAKDIQYWADRYEYKDLNTPQQVRDYARQNGHLDWDNLVKICKWKSQRPVGHVEGNQPEPVIEATKFCFTSTNELIRIKSPMMLDGVNWPTASVILHFCVDDSYPILDRRAIWSLSEEQPNSYNFDYWSEYVCTCRKIASKACVDVRTLDKALWQYSKSKQRLEVI